VPALVATGFLAFGAVAPLTQRTRLEVLIALVVAVPLALAGVVMWIALANAAAERQEITLGAEAITIRKTRRFPGRAVTIALDAIEDVGLASIDLRKPAALRHFGNPGWEGGRLRLPAIEHDGRITLFAEQCTPAEAEWLVATIRATIAPSITHEG
jgi:hypothetical protein